MSSSKGCCPAIRRSPKNDLALALRAVTTVFRMIAFSNEHSSERTCLSWRQVLWGVARQPQRNVWRGRRQIRFSRCSDNVKPGGKLWASEGHSQTLPPHPDNHRRRRDRGASRSRTA